MRRIVMNRPTSTLFWILLLILTQRESSLGQTIRVEDVYVLGPASFAAAVKGPQTQTITFSIGPNIRGPFKLTIVNGGPTAQNRDGRGVTRISAGRIKLNGQQLFGPSDFNQNVATLERDITLNAQNELQVTLASASTGVISVLITGK